MEKFELIKNSPIKRSPVLLLTCKTNDSLGFPPLKIITDVGQVQEAESCCIACAPHWSRCIACAPHWSRCARASRHQMYVLVFHIHTSAVMIHYLQMDSHVFSPKINENCSVSANLTFVTVRLYAQEPTPGWILCVLILLKARFFVH